MTPATESAVTSRHDFAAAYRAALVRALDTVDLRAVSRAIDVLATAREEGRTIFVSRARVTVDRRGSASWRSPIRFRP